MSCMLHGRADEGRLEWQTSSYRSGVASGSAWRRKCIRWFCNKRSTARTYNAHFVENVDAHAFRQPTTHTRGVQETID